MFEEKEGFEQINDNEILWRYQDLPRYLDLLIRKQLFFTRIDQFEDPFEGKYNIPDKQKEAENTTGVKKATPKQQQAKKEYSGLAEAHSRKRIAFTVNTWHRNDDENYAMWNIYARNYGIAIQTNYKKLKDCFHKSDKPVYIGKVIYYNESNQQIPMDDPLAPFLHKRCMYQYENEIRCCYIMSGSEENGFTWEEQDTYNGVFIQVDLDLLIERIYISPYAPEWYRHLVARTNEAFNIHKEIVHSTVFQSENFL
jgi:hypothetical protein